jgi:predicted metal-dependent phosphoesterase TrpH
MNPPSFDLQSHSRHSDGALAPTEVVAAAVAAGVELLALSDHDTVAGVAEARDAAGAHGIRLISAVEVSAVDPVGQDLHILGYGIDETDPGLLERLEAYRADRDLRSERMTQALRELGFEVDESRLASRIEAGKPIGRPHIAQAVVAHPANAQRLEEAGLSETSAFLEAYLIEGRPAFRSREKPSVAEAIDTIHQAGGLAVWAHPFWDVDSGPRVLETIDRFRRAGLDGVEAFYVTHTEEQTRLAAGACTEHSLLSTGSSDFHGPEHRLFSRFRAFETYGLEPDLGPIAHVAPGAR